MSMHISCTSSGIPTRIPIYDSDTLIAVSPCINNRFGPNMCSYTMMSYIFTGKYIS